MPKKACQEDGDFVTRRGILWKIMRTFFWETRGLVSAAAVFAAKGYRPKPPQASASCSETDNTNPLICVNPRHLRLNVINPWRLTRG
jgi:hypothetical protein